MVDDELVQGGSELSACCIRCDFHTDADSAPLGGCPHCRARGLGSNLTLDVPPAQGRQLTLEQALHTETQGVQGIWRFAPRLPVAPPAARVTLGEGNTPLVNLDRFGGRPDGLALWAKDESRNPTLSYKDRFMAAAISRARHVGADVVVAASTGNGGISAAAYAARAGLRCVVLTTPQMPDPPRRYIRTVGGVLLAVPSGRDRWALTRAAVEEWGWYPLTNFAVPPSGSNPFGILGYKTIAYEIVLQPGAAGANGAVGWRVPDWVVVPLAIGDGLYGIWSGFVELEELGYIDRPPRMVGVEPGVAAPVASAFAAGSDHPQPVPEATSIAYNVGSGRGSEQAMVALQDSDGIALAMPEEEIVPTRSRLATDCGLDAEASAVLSVWGACQVAGAGDAAVAVVTSSGLKDPDRPEPDDLETIPPSLEELRKALPEELRP